MTNEGILTGSIFGDWALLVALTIVFAVIAHLFYFYLRGDE